VSISARDFTDVLVLQRDEFLEMALNISEPTLLKYH
jgi:hypothetical protein